MRYIKSILVVLLMLNIIGCSSESSDRAEYKIQSDSVVDAKQRQRSNYLAYEHQLRIDLEKSNMVKAFEDIVSFCSEDKKYQCTMLHSSVNTGDYSSADIRVRILPDGVNGLFEVVSSKGEVTNKSTDVEDLQDFIVDGDKKLEMLGQYHERLLKLEKSSGDDIESLIKISSELSQVQSDLEYAEGEKAKLLTRVQMDIVNISLTSSSYGSFWEPVSDSLGEFGENLSQGVSQAIVAIAFLLPWFIIGPVFLYGIRYLWRKTNVKDKKNKLN